MSRVLRSWGNTVPESKFEEVMPKEEDIIDQVEEEAVEAIRNRDTFPANLEILPKVEAVKKDELSEVEKNEWADRVKAMTNTEREFIITRFSTPELYDEIHRRIIKDAEYISNIRELVSQYDAL